ncbi:MAG: lytic transglycosylase domain-containing protein [Actinobacteria bacterium]|nr:lytic transglycosylase domain-containing protein [Actinomycetota bacterium]
MLPASGSKSFIVELEEKLNAGIDKINGITGGGNSGEVTGEKVYLDLMPENFNSLMAGYAAETGKGMQEEALQENNRDPVKENIIRMVEMFCNETGVDPDLIKEMIKVESNFDPGATSGSGAMGLMQLMPDTAKSLGVTDAYDIYQNLNGGITMIKKLLESFNGDVKLALAAYNAGSGRVKEYGGVPPIPETVNYVNSILSAYNPALL